jgi:hypothetical protein
MAGVAKESLSRALNDFAGERFIVILGKEIFILDVQQLTAIKN